MKYLSESLKSNNSIQTLNLYCNNIRSEGMKYLSESLKSNNSIQTLDLGCKQKKKNKTKIKTKNSKSKMYGKCIFEIEYNIVF